MESTHAITKIHMSAECESKSQVKIHMRSTPAVKYCVKSTETKNPFEPP